MLSPRRRHQSSAAAAYESQGAPEHGVECQAVLNALDDSAGSRALVRELVRGGYLDAVNEIDQSDIPVTVRPSPIALRIMARWPETGPEAALDGLVEALNTAIASTDDEARGRSSPGYEMACLAPGETLRSRTSRRR